MADQKMGTLLNLVMDSTESEREKSIDLNVGFNENTRRWEVIVKYIGTPDGLEGAGISVVPLLGDYAVVTLPEDALEEYSRRTQVLYIEKPVRLYFQLLQGTEASCVRTVQMNENGLTGKGILVGMVDSGVDYRHPDFRYENGRSRILRLWDQSVPGNPPEGYDRGSEYTQEQIDEALLLSREEGQRLVPSVDVSGHGTAVLGVAAGNGRSSEGRNRGVAYESDLLVVKMGASRVDSFPRTTELMEGVDYLVRQAVAMRRPIVINLSFGNNYGSHRGDSLLETYLDQVTGVGQTVICVGTGNNGRDALHTGGKIAQDEVQEIQLGVGNFEPGLNVQLWKAYEDEVEIYLESPSGTRVGPMDDRIGTQRYRLERTELLVYYGKPSPYRVEQEIYVDFLPASDVDYVDSGVWKIILVGKSIKNGGYSLWLPGGNVLNRLTAFLQPRTEGTLTIPSSAGKVISVGAYDSRLNAYADFSGRGSEFLWYEKPDLVAPGVDITAPRVGGGYAAVTGTSFACPFVTGATALLLEWGLVRGNDPYLYGEKVKAYLRRGARPLPGYQNYPNAEVGWGALCVRDSLP